MGILERRKRQELLDHIDAHFTEPAYPRALMALMVSISGLAGFLCSVALLKTGLHSMGLRYLIASGTAYAVFLGLLRIWLAYARSCSLDLPVSDEEKEQAVSTGPRFTKPSEESGAPLRHSFDFIKSFSFEEGCFIVPLLLGFLVSAVAVTGYLIWIAPVLLSEVVLDGVVCYGVYCRVRDNPAQRWLGNSVRRTFYSFLTILLFFGMTGFALDLLAPHADSMGRALAEVFQSPE